MVNDFLRIEFGYKLVYNEYFTTHYATINTIIHMYFSYMTYLMNHATYF
jgi:hypothetical protein